MSVKAKALIEHVLAMENDAYLVGHPEWEFIVADAKAALQAMTPAEALSSEKSGT